MQDANHQCAPFTPVPELRRVVYPLDDASQFARFLAEKDERRSAL